MELNSYSGLEFQYTPKALPSGMFFTKDFSQFNIYKMELEYYNTENIVTPATGKPTIRINAKAGLFSISKTAIDKMKWVDELLGFAFEKSTKTWYIYFDEKGFKLRKKDEKVKYTSYSFNSKGLQEKITAETKSYMLGGETQSAGRFYYPLIG